MISETPRHPSREATRRIVRAVVVRPDLWWSAFGAWARMATPGWWRERPYLPLPDRRLWGFRMVTAYGRGDADPDPVDVISYLEWCRSTATRAGHGPTSTTRPKGRGRLSGTRSG